MKLIQERLEWGSFKDALISYNNDEENGYFELGILLPFGRLLLFTSYQGDWAYEILKFNNKAEDMKYINGVKVKEGDLVVYAQIFPGVAGQKDNGYGQVEWVVEFPVGDDILFEQSKERITSVTKEEWDEKSTIYLKEDSSEQKSELPKEKTQSES